MAAVAVEIADAIVSQLNTAAIANAPTFRRAYRAYFERKDLEVIRGTVIPSAKTIAFQSRTKTADEYEFQIGIHAAIEGVAATAEIDALIEMVEAVVDNLKLSVLTTASSISAKPAGVANEPIYDSTLLEELSVFRSIVTLSFRAYRA